MTNTIKHRTIAKTSVIAIAMAYCVGGNAAYAAAQDQANQIQEIVVTAQKRSENMQKASVSIDVVKGSDLAKAGVTNATQLQDLMPNVKFSVADQVTVNIRGLGTTDLNAGVDSAVAYSQDGIYLSHPGALSPILFDMQRVEVLLGPQGTLYGRNSNAGVVNFLSADPDFKLGGHAQLGYGNYNALNSEAAINLPVSDKLAVRVAGASSQHDAYQRDGSYDAESYAGRIKLLYKPTSNLSLLLAFDASSHRSTGTSYGWVCPSGVNLTAVPACAGADSGPWAGLNPIVKPLQGSRGKIWGVSATVNLEMDWANLTSLTAYKYYKYHAVSSPGLIGGANLFDYHHFESNRFFTQELRLSSKVGSKIKWVAGVYYSDEAQPFYQKFDYIANTAAQIFGGAPNNLTQYFPIKDSSYKSAAAFGDLTVPVTSTVRLRGGARYTVESKDATGEIINSAAGIGQLGPTQVNSLHIASWHFTWSAGLDWDITPRNLFYVTGSTGYKSGGLNNLPAASGLTAYDPEKVTSVEIGLKNRFLSNRLQVNLNAFHYSYDGYQSFVFYTPTGGPLVGATFFPTVNSQTATFEGGEIQGIWKFTPNDRLTFGYNYLHDRFGKFVIALPYAATIDQSGGKVPQTPESTFTVGLDHTFNLPSDYKLNIGVNTQFVSSFLAGGSYGAEFYTQGAYRKTNLTATLSNANGWTLNAFARNIENKATINTVAGGYPVLSNIAQVNAMVDAPRTFGFSLRKDF